MELIDDPRNIIVLVYYDFYSLFIINLHRSVIDATHDFDTQDAIYFAKAADPTGIRSVGVITNCDAVLPTDQHKACSRYSKPATQLIMI